MKFPITTLLTFCIFIFLTGISSAQSAENDPFLRHPALSPDGTQISFAYQGDIWVADADGGTARRLTVHESYEYGPQWSPDGKQLAFQGNRYGNDDIFVMDADGGIPQRLTYHSASDAGVRWGANGNLFFNSRRYFAQVERESEVHQISVQGGTPQRAFDAVGLEPAPSPDGRFIAFVRGTCRVAREAYKGPANRNIWIYDRKTNRFTQLTDFEGQDHQPEWGAGNQLFFLSAQNGRYNIYRMQLDASGQATAPAEAVTNYEEEGIRYFDVGQNGKQIVFEKGIDLYSLSADGRGDVKKLEFQVAADDRYDPVEHKTYSSQARGYDISPNEKYVTFNVHGEIFIKPNDKEKSRSVQLTDHPYNDGEPLFLNDSTIIFVSDRGGNYDLYAVRSSDLAEVQLYKTFKLQTTRLTTNEADEEDIYLSPDRKKIAYRRGRGGLIVADIAADGQLSNEQILLDGWDSPSGISWSPDSRWLAYSLDDLDFNQEIYIHPADNSLAPVNVSLHPRGDNSPVWSADGSKLGFLSTRNNGDSDVWFVWLKKSDWEKTQRDWEEDDEEDDKPKKDKKKDGEDEEEEDDDGVEPIQIDFEDIHERLTQVTRLAGNERNLEISKDGEFFFFTTNGGGRQGVPGDPELMKVKWDGKDMKSLMPKARVYGLQFDNKGKFLYAIQSGGRLTKINAESGKAEPQSFQAKMDVHRMEERKQVFNEAWRRLRDGFYDPNFHGRDWQALKDKYEARCMAASTTQDFRLLYNEMLGQLDASHMGMYGGNPEETQREQTGILGVDIVPVPTGVRVTRVIPGTPADRSESRLEVGDVIQSVNGEGIEEGTNFYSLLIGQPNERILLGVSRDGNFEEVVIRSTSSIRSELYREWVKERQRLTEEYSGGRLGYIHIQGMNWPSFERFERELTASGLGKEGIVIDVRFNGGGWTTDMLMAVLNVRQHAYTVPRGATDNLERENKQFRQNYPYGERLPLSSWTRPSIALCNENSYSNAEIFSHAFKTLDIGTLVGQPTFGAVISTGGAGLMDGSYVRMPFRAWYVKATGENMEHGPAVPDILISNMPDSKANGEDPQLRKAVEVLLGEIK
ncbi:MAG: S41 family peptidase [Bacteroidota bacterium]